MPLFKNRKQARTVIAGLCIVLLLGVGAFAFFVNRFLEPILRSRLHTLIIQGSDSLYQYKLGNLKANFFNGDVEVENLQIFIDNPRYAQLEQTNALPALTMELNLAKGSVKGVGILALLFRKKINIEQIASKDADIRLLRHIRKKDIPKNNVPLWRAMQPNIQSISVNNINLDGIKLLYKDADTTHAIKLQFDRCNAHLENIRIDSASANDETRIGFVKDIFMQFTDLKFRAADSTYKLKADTITYASKKRTFEIINFKIQPTLKEKEDFYKAAGRQEIMKVITFDKMVFTSFRLDQFIYNNTVAADSIYIGNPVLDMYVDKTMPPVMESKVGRYPHQLLLKANMVIDVAKLVIKEADINYTEKSSKTLQEGTLKLAKLNIEVLNVTNDTASIKQSARCTVKANGLILGGSPFNTHIAFYLDSVNGRFDAHGEIKNANASQLNVLSRPLASTNLRSFNMQHLQFDMKGNDLGVTSNVSMRYNNLFIVLQKTDEETGELKTKKFLTNLLNKFTLYDSNPGPGGIERKAVGIQRSRNSTQSFFALLWKGIFAGMQDVMMKNGRYE